MNKNQIQHQKLVTARASTIKREGHTPEEIKSLDRKISACSDLLNPVRANARKVASKAKVKNNEALAFA